MRAHVPQLNDVLFRCNILIEERHMQQLLQKIDTDGDGQISYEEFLKYFGKGSSGDKDTVSTVSHPLSSLRCSRSILKLRIPCGCTPLA